MTTRLTPEEIARLRALAGRLEGAQPMSKFDLLKALANITDSLPALLDAAEECEELRRTLQGIADLEESKAARDELFTVALELAEDGLKGGG